MLSPIRRNENLMQKLPEDMGPSWTVQELLSLSRVNNPMMVYLSETHVKEERVKSLRWRLGLKGCLAVGSNGLSGGIALFWHEQLDVKLLYIYFRKAHRYGGHAGCEFLAIESHIYIWGTMGRESATNVESTCKSQTKNSITMDSNWGFQRSDVVV